MRAINCKNPFQIGTVPTRGTRPPECADDSFILGDRVADRSLVTGVRDAYDPLESRETGRERVQSIAQGRGACTLGRGGRPSTRPSI